MEGEQKINGEQLATIKEAHNALLRANLEAQTKRLALDHLVLDALISLGVNPSTHSIDPSSGVVEKVAQP